MSLVKKGVSLATTAASQSNGRKTAGPITERGRDVSRLNAAKHWGRAESIRDILPTLGEKPEEFEGVREGLYRSLQPRDEFEALLVDDMVEIHWRLRRMVRAEAAAMATRRRERMAEADQLQAKMDAGSLHEIEPFVVPTLGLDGLHDSPPKFLRILEILKDVARRVREQGFVEECAGHLQTVYGETASPRGGGLMTHYALCLSEQESADDATLEASRQRFLRHIQQELAWFERRAECDRQARAELAVPRREAEMLKAEVDPAKTIMYQERLERCFERKWTLLMRHRLACEVRDEREARMCAEPDDALSAEN